MKKLLTIINDSEKDDMPDSNKQKEFLEGAYNTLSQLYQAHIKSNRKEYRKEDLKTKLDEIKTMLQDYAGVIADLNVTHTNSKPKKIITLEQDKLDANLGEKTPPSVRFKSELQHSKKHVEKSIAIGEQSVAHLDPLDTAKELWKQANNLLEKEEITGYLKCVHKLNEFMQSKNITKDELQLKLSDAEISPKGYAVLKEINKSSNQYILKENTLKSMTQMLRDFMGCVANPKKHEQEASNIQVNSSLLAIFGGIQKFKVDWKIQTHSLFFNGGFAEKEKKETTQDTKNFKLKYAQVSAPGILKNFKEQLSEASDEDSLNKIVAALKGGREYQILQSTDDPISKKLGTSSTAKFEKMIEETRKEFHSYKQLI